MFQFFVLYFFPFQHNILLLLYHHNWPHQHIYLQFQFSYQLLQFKKYSFNQLQLQLHFHPCESVSCVVSIAFIGLQFNLLRIPSFSESIPAPAPQVFVEEPQSPIRMHFHSEFYFTKSKLYYIIQYHLNVCLQQSKLHSQSHRNHVKQMF